MKKLLVLLIAGLALTGCVSKKTYVDPSFGKASYSDVKSVSKKYNIKIIVEFQRNGKVIEAVNKTVMHHVEKTLRATGIINPLSKDSKISIKVIVNNIADIGRAMAKGFGTGLTFGAIGTTVTDYYDVIIIYTNENATTITKNYKHALHTTIGNAKAPVVDVLPTTSANAFETVIEEVLLNFITEMQLNGQLTLAYLKSIKNS